MKNLITVGLMLICAIGLQAQTKSAFLRAAEESYANQNYYAAMDYYIQAAQFDSTDIDIFYKAGDAARNFQSYEVAEDFYTYVSSQDSDARYPYVSYHLAKMQQMQGKYDLAKRNYELYLSQYGGDNPRYTDMAKKEIASIEWAIGMIDHPDPAVSILNMGDEINTPQSEFGAILDGEQITYTSVSYYPEDRRKYSNKYIGKVLSTGVDSVATLWSDDFNRPNHHTANVVYNMNRSKMFYTICEYINDEDVRCDIYCRPVLGDGTYGPEMKLPNHINMDSVTTTQPNIGFDKATGQEVLYFVSDRPGGKGGLDIWSSNITGVDSFAEPTNVMQINTGGDDVSPFFHNNYQVLFFSSNGDLGLGGYDIFRSVKDGGFQKAINMGAPTNSSFNEVFYTLTDDGKKALFSSNRPGSQYVDEYNKACCYDIYQADIDDIIIDLNALTFDAKSLDSLEGVTVQLVDAQTGDVINTITNEMANDHIFQLERGKEYLLISSKPGFYPDTLPINTKTIFSAEELERKIYLERSTLDLQVFTFDEISQEALPGATVTLENLSNGTIQEVTLTNETAHDFAFEVVPGDSYRLTIERERYYPKTVEFVAKDDEGTGVITKNIYLVRRDLNIYLPLALYFDNDIPDERSRSLTTDQRYADTFDKYVMRKQDFQKLYARGLTGGDKSLAEQRIGAFFEEDLKGGYDRFTRFVDYLYGKLQDGESFDISIRGFASPRADTKYNLALSQRRVVSVQNELNAYKDGVLIPYIESGQLKITELSYGESLAPDNVSDALYNRAASIYSPEASRERRAEILEIKQGQ